MSQQKKCFCKINPGKKTCQFCVDRARKIRQQRIADGLCNCGEERYLYFKQCKKHYDFRKAGEKKRRNSLVCKCGNPKKNTRKYCDDCYEIINAKGRLKNAQRKAAGKCQCGRVAVEGRRKCTDCREKAHMKAAINVANGLCRCGGPLLRGRKVCQVCVDREHKRKSCSFKLYRPSTPEEIKKYGGKSAMEIIQKYWAVFGKDEEKDIY